MAITQAMTTSFKVEILQAYHAFGSVNPARSANTADTFKIALYTSGATLDQSTSVYTTSNEVTGTGYTAGGNILSVTPTPTSGLNSSSVGTAYLSFTNASATWSSATITAGGALIYNNTQQVGGFGRSVAVLNFGGDKSSTNGTFQIQFPTADANSAILRIS